MHLILKVSCISFCILTANTAIATECSNSGQAPLVPPNDSQIYSATACGSSALASGVDSTAVGSGAEVSGWAAAAYGTVANAIGWYSVALGYATSSVGWNSSAVGSRAESSGERSTALGFRAYADQPDTVVLGSVNGINGATHSAKVAIGTTDPMVPLHVARDDGSAQVLVEDTDSSATPKTLFKLSSNFNTKFEINNTDGATWAFTNTGSDFRISRQGSGVVELQVFNNGNATLSGALTQNSDRNAKQDIVPVNPEYVLNKVTALPVSTWAYKGEPEKRHLGPMAQDFHAAFGLGDTTTGISSIDTGGVALAAIQALEKRNRELEDRLSILEKFIADQTPKNTKK